MRRLAVLVTLVMLAACGGGSDVQRIEGTITTTDPRLCMGAPAAKGTCFDQSTLLGDHRVGECVAVRYRHDSGSDQNEIVDLRSASGC